MTAPKLKTAPHQGRNRSPLADDAWWYEGERSIRVYCWNKKRGIGMSVQIDRNAIEGWLKRAGKRKP